VLGCNVLYRKSLVTPLAATKPFPELLGESQTHLLVENLSERESIAIRHIIRLH
jgi:hypothetical protein